MSFVRFTIFDKPKDNFILTDEINAISNHHGPEENVLLIRHPRAAHNLLGYSPNVTTFKPRTLVELWDGGIWPEWKVMYRLFKNFGIVNAILLRENARQVARRERW